MANWAKSVAEARRNGEKKQTVGRYRRGDVRRHEPLWRDIVPLPMRHNGRKHDPSEETRRGERDAAGFYVAWLLARTCCLLLLSLTPAAFLVLLLSVSSCYHSSEPATYSIFHTCIYSLLLSVDSQISDARRHVVRVGLFFCVRWPFVQYQPGGKLNGVIGVRRWGCYGMRECW